MINTVQIIWLLIYYGCKQIIFLLYKMVYLIRKLPKQNLYRVYNKQTKKIYAYSTTLDNAKKQVTLLNMIDAGVPLKNGGKLYENKILSNNNSMPNKWIGHVKDYASKNGISYRDALRDPKCKEQYKPKSRKVVSGAGVIDEIQNQGLIAEMYNDTELGANAGKKFISL